MLFRSVLSLPRRRSVAVLVRETHAGAHPLGPVGPLPALFWQGVALGADVDERGSFVVMDAKGPSAFALTHVGAPADGRELGMRGVAENGACATRSA